ncbi:thymidine kinase [Cryptosporidium felis]|nr:thymidine kinase [Cryptosporidium felis]
MAKLYFYYSAMNAGKSTLLLQSSFNYVEKGMRTILFTFNRDNRFKNGEVASRIGLSETANTYSSDTEIYEILAKKKSEQEINCVLVDEAQFLTKKQVKDLCKIVDEFDIPTLCYGLRTDFKGDLFPGSKYLLAWADKLIEIKTICHCSKKATMTMRVDKNGNPIVDGEQILIGDESIYTSVCRKHHILHKIK